MTFDEEQAFLAPWAEQAKAGGILVVSVIRAALAQRLGRPRSPPSSIGFSNAMVGGRWPPDASPQSNPAAQEDWKKLPETLAALLTPEEVRGRRVRLMFQDEARFGRMVRMRRCWSPALTAPRSRTATNANSCTSTAPSARSRATWTG